MLAEADVAYSFKLIAQVEGGTRSRLIAQNLLPDIFRKILVHVLQKAKLRL